ncbi:gamma-type small acid-soluble spore protein [Sporosarcina sp. HYO08]|uniref:gamma-type small acid-soluble spore protein n=1 Tax=Sporosarcina sp. HYO08 TaxID=1759557 RepID=UPI0007977F63|nr:gamma-type small acid-soluble spore protein [Sporosarcina sp. HYO08]KXH78836.1 hypothetical protein AU377_12620 [Sporosarcina sp. HYO08]
MTEKLRRTKNARIYGEQNPGANPMAQVEFGTEIDVNQVKRQNQQAEAGKIKASGPYANRFGNSTK